MDPRIKKLAKLLVNYSTHIEKGDRCLIEYEGEETKPLIRQIVREVYAAGGYPFVGAKDTSITRVLMEGACKEQLELMCRHQMEQMKDMDAYIMVRANPNSSELSQMPPEKMKLWNSSLNPVLRQRVDKTKWVILRYPNWSSAQMAGSSLEAFEDYYFDVCTLDYAKMNEQVKPLVDLMNRTDKVRITGPGTDLSFSIKGIGAVPCCGACNIPDGEVYSAPVRDSVNGRISFNTQSLEMGFTYENIVFEIKDGKIVKATANDNERINTLLDTDEGARYFGEFSIGINPFVQHPMKDTLFDEKIDGSFHLTPGACYEDAPNGNSSAVHWDLVMIQRPDYGGGEIWFDDVLIRKDGRFVIPELEALNPENLK